jgi:hypothetical protein
MEAGTPITVTMMVAAEEVLSFKTNSHRVAIAHSVVTVFQFRVVAPTDSTFSIAVFDNLV